MYMMQEFSDHSQTPCFPKDASLDIDTAEKVFSDFLKAHPQTADFSAGVVMGSALAQKYRCAKSN